MMLTPEQIIESVLNGSLSEASAIYSVRRLIEHAEGGGRGRLAGHALQGLLAASANSRVADFDRDDFIRSLTASAVELADLMLRELNKHKPPTGEKP